MRRLISAKKGGKSVVTLPSTPQAPWMPTPSAELTALEAFVGANEGAQLYVFDGDSNQRSFALLGGISSGAIGFAHNWLDPGVEARGASATDTQRPALTTTGGIVSAYFDGDRATDEANDRLTIPHITQARYIAATLVYLDRNDGAAQEVVAQTNHWRLHAFDTTATGPQLRTGNATRTSFGGASAYQNWTLLLTITDLVAGKQWVRRGGGAWVEAALDATTPWLDGSIYNQVSLLGRGNFTPSSGEPFRGAVRAWAMVPKLPTTANEEQAVIDMVLNGTGISDTSPGAPGAGGGDPPSGEYETWNAVQQLNIPALSPVDDPVSVGSATALSTAISAATAGDHIVLANGSYAGTYTISASGTQANPIVVRPANFLGATLTGTLTITGQWVIVYGLNTQSIIMDGGCQNSRISRCVTTGGNSYRIGSGGNRNNCIDRCSCSGGTGRLMEMRSGSTICSSNCFIWNHLFSSSGTDSSNPAPFQATALSYERFNDDLQCLFAWNLVENNGYSFAIQAKGSGVTWYQNTIKNSGATAISCRHGRDHRVLGNWIPNAGVGIRGDDALIAGNINNAGGSNQLSANTGNIVNGSDGETTTALRPGWTFARRARFIGNTAPLRIGYTSSLPYQPVDCLVEAHTGSVSIFSGATGTIDRRNSPPSIEVPPAFELTAAQVGPYS